MKTMRCRGLSLLIAWSSGLAAQGLPPVAWVLDESRYHATPVAADGISRDYFPDGDGPDDWTERFSIRVLGRGSRDLDQRFEEQTSAQRTDCPDLSSKRMRSGNDVLPVWMSNCPRDASGHGWSRFTKIVLVDDDAYLASAEHRGDPFAKGKLAAIGHDDINRYVDFLASFAPCTELTTPGCIPGAALMGKYGDAILTEEESREAAAVERRGLALYRQDQLAWHATDYVTEHRVFDLATGGGFLSVAGEGRAGSTYFFAKSPSGEDPHVMALIVTDVDGELHAAQPPAILPDELSRRWRARSLAMKSDALQVCAKAVNTAVLADVDGSWWVYVMSAVSDERSVLLGGHNRVHIDPDGHRILSVEHSANSCLSVDAKALRAMKSGESAFFTHFVSPLPWETDVMQSLTYAFPLTRVTETGAWRIEGDHLHKYALTPASSGP